MATKVPSYSFTGTSSSELVKGVWYIYLKSSGTLKMAYGKASVDVFLCGAGGGGRSVSWQNGGGGGAGGYLNTAYGQAIASDSYSIVVGEGGAANTDGGATTAFGLTAAGGAGAPDSVGGAYYGATNGTAAGGDGGMYWDGASTARPGSAGADGQLAFGTGSILYGAGGGGGGSKYGGAGGAGGTTGGGAGNGGAGQANTGAGGGGAQGVDSGASSAGGAGGSGIVILRGTEDDFAPVWFDGTQLSEIFFNGTRVTGLIYGGVRLFARRCEEWLCRRWACRSAFRRATPAA